MQLACRTILLAVLSVGSCILMHNAVNVGGWGRLFGLVFLFSNYLECEVLGETWKCPSLPCGRGKAWACTCARHGVATACRFVPRVLVSLCTLRRGPTRPCVALRSASWSHASLCRFALCVVAGVAAAVGASTAWASLLPTPPASIVCYGLGSLDAALLSSASSARCVGCYASGAGFPPPPPLLLPFDRVWHTCLLQARSLGVFMTVQALRGGAAAMRSVGACSTAMGRCCRHTHCLRPRLQCGALGGGQ
jgi:hypothetical protein